MWDGGCSAPTLRTSPSTCIAPADRRAPVKLNQAPLVTTTNLVDTSADLTQANSVYRAAGLQGTELARERAVRAAGKRTDTAVPDRAARPARWRQRRSAAGFADQRLHLQPQRRERRPISTATASTRSSSNGIRRIRATTHRRACQAGNCIDAYKIDGTRLWRIDLGRNIRAGAHYTQFMVYDLDGDGRAELACKTADGTVDGAGTVIGDATKDYRSLIVPTDGIQVPATNDARYGKVLAGPEYFTIFDGLTGAALATTAYLPGRDPLNGWGGDRRQRQQRQQRQPRRSHAGRRRLSRRAPAKRRHGARLLRPLGPGGVGLEERAADLALGLRLGHRRGTLSLSHRLAVLGPGQSQSLGCRRRCRRQGRNRLRLDGRRRRRHRTVLDQAAARRRDARQRHGPVETRPRGLRRPRERRPDDCPRHAGHGALRRAHRADSLEHAAWVRTSGAGWPPTSIRDHPATSSGAPLRSAWSTARDSASPTHRAR